MALPVDEAYLRSAHPDVRKFWKIVARRAPDDIQSRVSEFTSEVSEGKCIFRDRGGNLLHETPDAPPPVEAKKTNGPDVYVRALEKRVADSRELGLHNAHAVVEIAETTTTLLARVKEVEEGVGDAQSDASAARRLQVSFASDVLTLKTKITGIQARIDREGRGIFFRGAWQPTIDYETGSIVTHGKRAYVAIKALRSGGEVPSREGGGWTPLFDSAQIPGPQLENVADEVVEVIREVTTPLKDRIASLENEIAQLHAQIKNKY